MLLEISGEATPERMKGWSQHKNSTQLWMGLVIEARSDAVKSLNSDVGEDSLGLQGDPTSPF